MRGGCVDERRKKSAAKGLLGLLNRDSARIILRERLERFFLYGVFFCFDKFAILISPK